MKKKLRVILDTNILLVSISSNSKYHWVLEKLLNAEYDIIISNEIINEYEEVITRYFSNEISDNIIRTLLLLENIEKHEAYFNWNLILNDNDDNKFVDCAIASNADYIITNDKHFDILNNIEFPIMKTLTISEFKNFF